LQKCKNSKPGESAGSVASRSSYQFEFEAALYIRDGPPGTLHQSLFITARNAERNRVYDLGSGKSETKAEQRLGFAVWVKAFWISLEFGMGE